MANKLIKEMAKKSGVKLWEIAEELGISDSQLSRFLRHDFDVKQTEEVLSIIRRIAESRDPERD